MDFKFDENAIDRLAKDATKQIANELQETMDALLRTQRGKPVAEVKMAVKREWERRPGATITDPELTTYAEALTAGTRITLQAS